MLERMSKNEDDQEPEKTLREIKEEMLKIVREKDAEIEKLKAEGKAKDVELEKTKLELKIAQTTIKDLENKRHVDSLTGLPNNPEIVLNKLIKELNFSDENRETDKNRGNTLNAIGVAYIDMNNLKTINDTYSHNIGDQAIIAFSERLKEIVKGADLIFRPHGDEFIIIFPMRNLRNNRVISYKALDKLFLEFEKRVNTNLFLKIKDGSSGLQLSASMDYVILREGESRDAKELIEESDKRMQNKKGEFKKSR